MANPEHLEILKQGVEAWNKWRKENPSIRPDLSKAELDGTNLNRANLSDAIIIDAKLNRAVLQWANLNKADLSNSWLIGANLSEANLMDSNLIAATLYDADLAGADFCKARLRSTNIRAANLFSAKLQQVDLTRGDLHYCNLSMCNLSGAKLTGTKLYGTARDDWIIKDVECKYVYWDWFGEQRSPKDRDLEPGEFERLYASLPTIEYIFENGMTPIDPLIMDRVVQAIREKQPEFDIKIDSINARGLAPSIKFTVQHEKHKKPALTEVKKGYEIKLEQLESERDRYYELLSRALDAPREVKLISAGPGAIVATDGSTVNIQQPVHNALELQKAIADEPEESESFAKVAKKTALGIVGEAIKDIAKGQIKEAAKQIIELGKDLGPLLVRMAPAAYEFFKNIGA